MNFDDMLYYDAEELRKQVDDTLRKERDAEIEKEVTQKATSEVTNAIALKMIKDNLSKEQVIKYCQLSDEEYETLKKWSLINNYHWLFLCKVEYLIFLK